MLCRQALKFSRTRVICPKIYRNCFFGFTKFNENYGVGPATSISRSTHTKSKDTPKANKQKLLLKTAKGTADHNPQQMALRQSVLQRIVSVFEKHGAEAIDTPVFERKELLTGKYGDDSKLIYELEDQGGEMLALRYDLTVPFARYLAMNKIETIKRYQIGKVYRRDTPSIVRGRFREFLQCDFDIVGHHDVMLPDAECLKVVSEIMDQLLDSNEYVIRVNHRLLLDGILAVCGVPAECFRTICSSIDKYDGKNWSEVRDEMIGEKGLDEETADKIHTNINIDGKIDVLEQQLSSINLLNASEAATKGFEELKVLAKYCEILGLENRVIYDMKLARGLDYYTGIIFEAELKDDRNKIGSVAGGGRYDNLIGVLNDKGKSIPCIGASIGVERICSLLEAKMTASGEQLRTNLTDVYVISAHKGVSDERLKLVNMLWEAGIRAEHSPKKNPKILLQIQRCEKFKIPLGIIVGASELERNAVKLRTIETRDEVDIPIDELVNEIKKRLGK